MAYYLDKRHTKSEHQKSVELFMAKAGQECPTKPCIPSTEIRKLRATLILEEALETINGLGFSIEFSGESKKPFQLCDNGTPDLIEIIDGCCDVKVVTTGTLLACGVPDTMAQEIVDQSNLGRFGPGSYKRDDGKWIRPPDWVSPRKELEMLVEFLRENS